MNRDVIIACDFASRDQVLGFLEQFKGEKPFVKIGMELFYGEGPDMVREIKARGHRIFLDLKLHDIPNTVHKAMKNLGRLGVDMTNLHAAGGSQMMRAALEGLAEGAAGAPAMLIGVTQLTSTTEAVMHDELLIPGDMNEVVASYSATTKAAGLAGVVCSPLEVKLVKQRCGDGFVTVTPGIRYPDAAGTDDQKRITTPEGAKALGSDFIVVGRPITAAANPVAAWQQVRREFVEV